MACYLQVLVVVWPDPVLSAELDCIVEPPQDAAEHATLGLGSCPGRGWSPAAWAPPPCALGMPTWIVPAIRIAEPRRLTQHLAGWLDVQTVPDGSPLAGVQFASRHGDELAPSAVFERVGDTPPLTSCTTAPAVRSTRATPSSPKLCSSTDSPGPADPARPPTPGHTGPGPWQGHWTCSSRGGAGRATAGA